MGRILIYNANIVNEGEVFYGSVVINNDLIEEILRGNTHPIHPCEEEINAENAYLMPGVIDEHVHFREPGLTEKADIRSESMAAAAGGVTSVMDMPNTVPQTVTLEALQQKRDLYAQKCIVNYACYFGATNDNANLFHSLDPHRVCGIKIFLGSSTGNMLVNRFEDIRRVFSEAEILVAAHCESQTIINANLEKYKPLMVDDDLPFPYHYKIRSTDCCFRASICAIRLARNLNTHLHILHISTLSELKLFNTMDVNKKRITAETCTGYLLYSASDYMKKGTMIKVNPALKTFNNRDLLRRAVNLGKIDTIATDHAPHLLRDKTGGALKAASGMPIIQFSLPALLELVTQNIFTIQTLVEKMCHNPAKIYEISRRGFIRTGYKADLVLVKEEEATLVDKVFVLSKCRWTPLQGERLHWHVKRTFVNGRQVYDGEYVDDSCRGEELYFRE